MPKTWTIDDEAANERLDVFLTSALEGQSRSSIQKAIKQGQVLVNGKTTTVHHFLKLGDEIAWDETSGTTERPARRPSVKIQAPSPKPFHASTDLNILAETADWIVIDKPAGLLVHPDEVSEEPTLIDGILKHDSKIAKVGEDPNRPGIVHRLDREVSGLMIIAKNQDAFDFLKEQFGQRKIKKTYLALVHGEISQDFGDIKFRIARSTSKARMAARPQQEEEGKAAWTHYRVLERFRGATLVELEILSGRTHQIRAHMHALGHPVMGDALYALRRTDRNVKAPRLMLQSVGLTFIDPTHHEEQSFQLDPDPAFAALVEEFRRS